MASMAELKLLDELADAKRSLAIVEAREREAAYVRESQRRTIALQKENLVALDARIRELSAPSDRVYQERDRFHGYAAGQMPKKTVAPVYGGVKLTLQDVEAARAAGDAFVTAKQADVAAIVDEQSAKVELELWGPPAVKRAAAMRPQESGRSAVADVKELAPRHRVRRASFDEDAWSRRHAAVVHCQNEDDLVNYSEED
jgi:hypothetical protein